MPPIDKERKFQQPCLSGETELAFFLFINFKLPNAPVMPRRRGNYRHDRPLLLTVCRMLLIYCSISDVNTVYLLARTIYCHDDVGSYSSEHCMPLILP